MNDERVYATVFLDGMLFASLAGDVGDSVAWEMVDILFGIGGVRLLAVSAGTW